MTLPSQIPDILPPPEPNFYTRSMMVTLA